MIARSMKVLSKLLLVATIAALSHSAAMSEERFSAKFSRQSAEEKANWLLRRDFQLDAKLKNPTEDTLSLAIQTKSIGGTFLAGKAGSGSPTASIFTGEILSARTTPILTLRQSHDSPDPYFAVHTGVLVSAGKYRGTWYDSCGGSGDFELTLCEPEPDETYTAAALLEALQGKWTLAHYEVEGKTIRGPDDRCKISFEGEKWTARWMKDDGSEQREEGHLRIVRAAAEGSQVDLIHTSGPYAGQTSGVLLQASRNSLRHCCGTPRATQFSTIVGRPDLGLLIYSRER